MSIPATNLRLRRLTRFWMRHCSLGINTNKYWIHGIYFSGYQSFQLYKILIFQKQNLPIYKSQVPSYFCRTSLSGNFSMNTKSYLIQTRSETHLIPYRNEKLFVVDWWVFSFIDVLSAKKSFNNSEKWNIRVINTRNTRVVKNLLLKTCWDVKRLLL